MGVRGGFPPCTAAVSKHERKICDPAPGGVLEGGPWGSFPPGTATVTKQLTRALQFMVAFALREEGELLREYISLRCALGGGRSVPAKTSTPLVNTSEHDTPLLCQARDNPAVSKHDKYYCTKAVDILLSQSTRLMLGQTTHCCDQSTGHMLCHNKRHTTVLNYETRYCIKAKHRCCDAHGRLLCHSTTHQTVRALPSIEHRTYPRTQHPSPEKNVFGL